MKKLTNVAASTKFGKVGKAAKAASTGKGAAGNGGGRRTGKAAGTSKAEPPSFLHVAMAKRSREGLNKLVEVMAVPGQRQVLEQLIADELHRRGMRLPRA